MCISQGSIREVEPVGDLQEEISCKELAYMIVGANKARSNFLEEEGQGGQDGTLKH